MKYDIPKICGYGLTFQWDGFREIFTIVTVLAWILALLLSIEYMKHEEHKGRYYFFTVVTLFATLGVFCSGDFFTAFIFFEIMSFTSYTWVAQTEKREALRAADTYLAIAVIGGLAMLMGLFLLYHMYGTLDFDALAELTKGEHPAGYYAAGICILTGFGAKAGAFPLHIWLPKAHPVAPAPASALLSGVLTKTGIFGVIVLTTRLFGGDVAFGTLILVLGAATMLLGAVLAVFALDLKRTLACSSVSQIGFILVGLGMCCLSFGEHGLAAHGAVLHMVNHSLMKLVLFLSAGVIYRNTHCLDLNEIRGFGRKKPLLAGCFLAGALAIGGIPGFGGYISKTLLHESILEYGGGLWFKVLEMLFIFSGGLTVAYMTKLFVTIFIEKNVDSDLQKSYEQNKSYAGGTSVLAISIPAVCLLLWGIPAVMDRAADRANSFFRLESSEAVRYFSGENLLGAFSSIAIGALVYVLVIRGLLTKKDSRGARQLVNPLPDWLDLENLVYRPLLHALALLALIPCRVADTAVDLSVVLLRKTIYRDTPLPRQYSQGNSLTRGLGRLCNRWRDLANHTWRRKTPIETDYVEQISLRADELNQSAKIITRSISFGLLLFGLGFCLMLFYLIAGDL